MENLDELYVIVAHNHCDCPHCESITRSLKKTKSWIKQGQRMRSGEFINILRRLGKTKNDIVDSDNRHDIKDTFGIEKYAIRYELELWDMLKLVQSADREFIDAITGHRFNDVQFRLNYELDEIEQRLTEAEQDGRLEKCRILLDKLFVTMLS